MRSKTIPKLHNYNRSVSTLHQSLKAPEFHRNTFLKAIPHPINNSLFLETQTKLTLTSHQMHSMIQDKTISTAALIAERLMLDFFSMFYVIRFVFQ